MKSSDADSYVTASSDETQVDRDVICIQNTGISDSAISLLEKPKRRKVGEYDSLECFNAKANYRRQIEITPACDESLTECERQSDPSEPLILCDIADSVDDRLCALQHLLPRGSELEKDEVLKVAIDYVKALEREIQAFDYYTQDWSTCTKPEPHKMALDGSKITGTAVQSVIGEEPGPSEGSALQKRGLCIVPLSALAKAF